MVPWSIPPIAGATACAPSADRSALSAIDNAEVPASGATSTSAGGDIAGAVKGLGATEVSRRRLTDEEIRRLLGAEIDERLDAAAQLARSGGDERAAVVRAEAAVLAELLG